MLEYIYFVKCPGYEDEHFDFFNDAKDFAMSLLSKKPIITQIEVDRNDFGECVNSADLGTVWSWEDMMKETDAEPAVSVFTKADLECCDAEQDSEFATLDNSLDFVPDNLRKPVPADMTIKDLVEAMEENEDEVECVVCEELHDKEDCRYDEKHGWICEDCDDETVECTWCEELYDYSECRKEVDLGWLCGHCEAAIKSRGEKLTFVEGSYWDFLDESTETSVTEAFNPKETVDFEYDDLEVTLQGQKRDVDDWDTVDLTVDYTYTKSKEDVATDIWENFIEEVDAKDIEGGLETLEDDKAWNDFLDTHFDDLFEKYYDKLLEFYRDAACDKYEETHGLEDVTESHHHFLEELEEAADYRNRLVDCPECGVNESFDHETGICINCGFNI